VLYHNQAWCMAVVVWVVCISACKGTSYLSGLATSAGAAAAKRERRRSTCMQKTNRPWHEGRTLHREKAGLTPGAPATVSLKHYYVEHVEGARWTAAMALW
jgi:hypothetical protein